MSSPGPKTLSGAQNRPSVTGDISIAAPRELDDKPTSAMPGKARLVEEGRWAPASKCGVGHRSQRLREAVGGL